MSIYVKSEEHEVQQFYLKNSYAYKNAKYKLKLTEIMLSEIISFRIDRILPTKLDLISSINRLLLNRP